MKKHERRVIQQCIALLEDRGQAFDVANSLEELLEKAPQVRVTEKQAAAVVAASHFIGGSQLGPRGALQELAEGLDDGDRIRDLADRIIEDVKRTRAASRRFSFADRWPDRNDD